MNLIGITERGDAAVNLEWKTWVKEGKPAILITKDPNRLSHFLTGRENVIIHCTITGMGHTKYEPGVLPAEEELIGYTNLVKSFGVERVVLRVDPIITTPSGIETAIKVIEKVHPGGRIRISFLDMYNHVQERFKKAGLPIPHTTTHAPIEERRRAWRRLLSAADVGDQVGASTLEVCGEPGFQCHGCVSATDCKVLGVDTGHGLGSQRPTCACLAIKTELLKNRRQCIHKCVYCYWK